MRDGRCEDMWIQFFIDANEQCSSETDSDLVPTRGVKTN